MDYQDPVRRIGELQAQISNRKGELAMVRQRLVRLADDLLKRSGPAREIAAAGSKQDGQIAS